MSLLILQEISEDGESSKGENSTQIDNEGNFQKFFINDIVCRPCKHDKNQNFTVEIGIVCYPKYVTTGERLENTIRNGFIKSLCVYWFNTKSLEDVHGDEIQLVDRDISEGMTVKREGFVGNVIDSTTYGVVRCLKTSQIIANVPASDLHPAQKVGLGDIIMHSSGWLGLIAQEDFVSIILMKDGKTCSCKWSKDARSNSPKGGSIADRIKYVGQSIRLSKFEAIFEVTWHKGSRGHLGLLTASKCLDGVVESIETILHVNWVQNITTSGLSESPPDSLVPTNSTEFTVLCSNEKVTIGSIMELQCEHQESWQRHSHETWLSSLDVKNCQRCTEKSVAFDLETNANEIDMAIESQNKGHGEPCHCEPVSSTDAISLWRTLYPVSSMGSIGESLTVEVLYFTTWITVSWSNGFIPLDYRPAHEVEPLLFNGDSHHMRLGSVVKFAKLIQNQPSATSYYGIITSVGHGDASVDWFHISMEKNPVFIGATKLQMDRLELHPMWNYHKGETVVTDGIVLELELSIGTFQNVTSDGLFVVQLLNGKRWRYNPKFLRRLYDTEGMRQADAYVEEPVSCAFKKMQPWSPSLFNVSSGRISFSSPAQCQFIDLNSSVQFTKVPKSIKTRDIISHIEDDLHRYNGGTAPKIWLKTFAACKDLIYVAMEGPPSTLYEDVLFFFTIELSDSYPQEPPIFFYHSYSPDQVNPCLHVNGMVLCPLLNSYPNRLGFRQEAWDPEDPSIGVILLCIQKIMLGSVPYENDSSFGLLQLISSSWCNKLCRKNNLKYTKQLVTTVRNQILSPHDYWERECVEYYRCHAPRFYNRIRDHICCSSDPGFCETIPLPQPLSFDTVHILTSKLEELRRIYNEKFTNERFNNWKYFNENKQ